MPNISLRKQNSNVLSKPDLFTSFILIKHFYFIFKKIFISINVFMYLVKNIPKYFLLPILSKP